MSTNLSPVPTQRHGAQHTSEAQDAKGHSLYIAEATSTGGRDGKSRSSDGKLEVKLSTPKELGGAGGEGTNPEQMFAAGYSACFIGALKFVAGQAKQLPADSSITAKVGIGQIPGGFGLDIDLHINLPGLAQAEAEDWSRRRTTCALTPTPPATMWMSGCM